MAFDGNYMRIQSRIWRFNPRPAGVFGERAPPRWGASDSEAASDSAPPPPTCLTRERVVVARWARWKSKALDEYFLRKLLKILKRSRVRSNSGQRTITSLFALSATESGLITAANPNSAKRHPKG